jgi:nitric oxide reductase NorD protein
MYRSYRRHERSLKAELARNLGFFFFESSEITSVIEGIDTLGRAPRQKALALCVYLSNISGRIVPKIVQYLLEASAFLPPDALEKWVTRAFDLMDAQGLEPAVRFLSQTDEASLSAFIMPGVLYLADIAPALETYIRGISGTDFRITPAEAECYTDTSEIRLPSAVQAFREHKMNYILYKLMCAHLWGQTVCGTFFESDRLVAGRRASGIEELFNGFVEKTLALDIYRVLEAVRVEKFIRAELPGLARQAGPVKASIFEKMPTVEGRVQKTAFVENILRQYLSGSITDKPLIRYAGLVRPDLSILSELYQEAASMGGPYISLPPGPLPCGIKPEMVTRYLVRRKEELKKRLKGLITSIEDVYDLGAEIERRKAVKPPAARQTEDVKSFLLLKGAVLELDEELDEMVNESGGIPGAILMDGKGAGGESRIDLRSLVEDADNITLEESGGGIKFDEWDYRRSGYRKGWCTLFVRDIHPSVEPFVQSTLNRYGGYVGILRKKFELIRNQTRILKRQKEGEDIDIDAFVEAIADLRAGLSPGENLFTKLVREERDIATLFLLDMSGSTKGWINTAEKESLVLMCEAMESLRDRYAIYGFSGMTRSRCDFYRIKSFEDTYSEDVKKRIAGITPKDYTRMGPAIRHSTGILRSVDARTKLLITLSDGKPEDHDAYKGPYGIEDTRKALVEAKQQAIHSFCITIDRKASEYLPHMYGEVNYTFIDNVYKLPAKITEIYTRLTT